MALSQKAQEQLSQHKTHLIDISKERLENPSDFDAIIIHFRKLESGLMSIRKFMNSYADVNSLDKRLFELQEFTDELNRINSCRELEDIRNQLLEKESRITKLHLHLDAKNDSHNFFKKHEFTYTYTYSIKFSDNDVISFHSLDDVRERRTARDEFDRKMNLLAAEYKPAFSM